MKITHIELLLLRGVAPFSHGSFSPLVVRLCTDEGLLGYGELSMAIGSSRNEAIGAVRDIAPMVLGEDFRDSMRLRQRMTKDNLWAMSGGCALYAAISAIDTALWDLKARWLGVPLYQLLGGKMREELPCYASQLQFGWHNGDSKAVAGEALARQAVEAAAQGYRWIKFDPFGYSPDGVWKGWPLRGALPSETVREICSRVAAVRDAVGGQMQIILENHCLTDAQSAVTLIRALEGYHIDYYEEVCTPINHAVWADVRKHTDAGLCTGEKLVTQSGFLPYIVGRTVDMLQPDLGICGGVSEIMPICAMAELYDIGVSLHTCHSPISIAASLQVEAVLPNFCVHEVHKSALLEENIALGSEPLCVKNGKYTLPEGNGIGVELSDWALRNCERLVF